MGGVLVVAAYEMERGHRAGAVSGERDGDGRWFLKGCVGVGLTALEGAE